MIKLVICGVEREYGKPLVSWIREQFSRRKDQGHDVWFRVILKGDNVSVILSSNNCPQSVGRPKVTISQQEQHFVDLWNDLDVRASGDMEILIRFLHQAVEMLN